MLVEEFQADVDAENNKGETAMNIAAKKGNLVNVVMTLGESNAFTILDLSGSNVGSDGAHALAESLKQNTTLIQLNLKGNNIGSEGAQALAGALKQNVTLTLLNPHENANLNAVVVTQYLEQNLILATLDLKRTL